MFVRCSPWFPTPLVRGLALGTLLLAVTGTRQPLHAQQPPAVEVEGQIEVLYEEDFNVARLHHFLTTRGGRLRLSFPGEPPALQTGARVRARGRLVNGTLALASSGDLQTLALDTSGTFGEQRTIVILVTFADLATPPYTVATADQVTFQTVNDFYRENSYGQTSIAGDVFGWFPIAMNSTVCDISKVAALAEEAAVAAGAKLSNYARRIYGFPKTSACSWWGQSTVGGNPSKSWVNGTYSLQVVAHELGHALGNYHSHSQPCTSIGCSIVEYGDTHDIMGNKSTGHMNTFQKERLGWVNYGISPPVQVVDGPGTYWIESLAVPGSASKALKILRGLDANGRRIYYYVELRTQVGFDAGVAPGVIVHTGTELNGSSSNQIDLDPVTSTFDGLLNVGQTFTDATISLSITATSVGSTSASVDVAYQAASCVASAPTVTLSPSGTVSTTPGSSLPYVVSVRNNDAAACQPSSFSLSSVLPAGWSASFTSDALAVSPGATASTGMTLVVPNTASGEHTFQVSATGSGLASSVSGTVLVGSVASCVAGKPTILLSPSGTVSAAPGSSLSYAVSIQNNDSAACAPSNFYLSKSVPSGWAASLGATAFTLAAGATASTSMTLTVPSTASGEYAFQANVDHAGYGVSVTGAVLVMSASSCVASAPSVSLSPSGTVSASPGSSLAYAVSVRNNDSANCASSSFTLSSIVPTGWSATFTSTSLSAAAGATASTNMTLAVPSTASGQQVFQVAANRAGLSGSVSGTVLVGTVTALDVKLTVTNAGQNYKLAAKVAAGGVPVAGALVSFAVANPLGTVKTLVVTTDSAGTALATYKPAKTDPKGTYTVTVTASTNGVSGSATATFVY